MNDKYEFLAIGVSLGLCLGLLVMWYPLQTNGNNLQERIKILEGKHGVYR